MIPSLQAVLEFLDSGLLGLSGWQIFAYTMIVTHITIASVTIYLHRHQAHRALDLHAIPSHFFRFWLWLTTGQVTKMGFDSPQAPREMRYRRRST